MASKAQVVPGISISGNYSLFVEKCFYRLLRLLRPLLNPLGIGIGYDRYSKTLSVYSLRQDKKNYEHLKNLRCLNLGAGGFVHRRWLNFDYPGESPYYRAVQGRAGVDFQPLDLRESMPNLEPGSVGLIYMSHTLEHLTFQTANQVLSSCNTLLVAGGCLRVVVPDVKRLFDYSKIARSEVARTGFFDVRELAFLTYSPSTLLETATLHAVFDEAETFEVFAARLLSEVDETKAFDAGACSPDYHLSFWSPEGLAGAAAEVGYSNVRFGLKNDSFAAAFGNKWVFDTTVPEISLYCDFIK